MNFKNENQVNSNNLSDSTGLTTVAQRYFVQYVNLNLNLSISQLNFVDAIFFNDIQKTGKFQ